MINRALCVLISVIMLFGLISCSGGSKQLPDVYIDLEVTDFITAEEIDRPYSYEATHSYDSESHMDTVNITLKVEQDYGDEVFYGKCIYYYDKSSDLWECSRSALTSWQEGEEELIERYLETTFEKLGDEKPSFRFPYSGVFSITINDLEFENGTVTCTYYMSGETNGFGRRTVTASGENEVFALESSGKSFVIPADNGSFRIYLDVSMGIYVIINDN